MKAQLVDARTVLPQMTLHLSFRCANDAHANPIHLSLRSIRDNTELSHKDGESSLGAFLDTVAREDSVRM